MKRIFLLVIILLCLTVNTIAQSSWNWKDPNDFGIIDFGDNKVILYNLIGTDIALWLDRANKSDAPIIHEASFAYIKEYQRDPLSELFISAIRRGYRIRPYLILGPSLRYIITSTEGADVHGIGGGIWFKWLIINKERFRLAYDNGVGPNYFIKAFPTGGTKFNFTTDYALSFEFRDQQTWFTLRLANIHISNADILGRERNKALDGIGIRIGMEF